MSQLYDTLVSALQRLGCNTSQFEFDTHSTIVMNFSDIGELLFDPGDGVASMWGVLDTNASNGFSGRAQEILELLTAPANYMGAGCMAMRDDGDRCLVGGAIHPDVQADAVNLSEAIESFHGLVSAIQGVLR